MSDEAGKPEAKNKSGKEAGAKDKQFRAGVAVGIGSAAIVAALLYARTGKPKKS